MPRIMISVFVTLFLTFPLSTYALEQSFTQSGLKAVIKLTPDELEAGKEVNLGVRLEKDGQPVTDRNVTLEVYEKDSTDPAIRREVDLLDGEYIDSWSFDKTGDYKVVIGIANPQKPDEALHYEVKASVSEAGDGHNGHEEHGFFSHHFGSKWGWWGMGIMILMMVPMMIVAF